VGPIDDGAPREGRPAGTVCADRRGVHFEDFGLRAFFCLFLLGGFTVTRSESQYRECFENAKYAIYVHDLNGRYTMVNKAGEALIGYSREEILQMTISDIVPESCRDQIQASMKKLADNIPAIYEVEAIRKDGSRVPVEVSSCLIYENGVPVAVQDTARDITEQKRAEEALRTCQLQLQQSQKLEVIGQLASGVAHDFNDLLTAILGYTDLSLRRSDVEDPVRHNLEETKKAAERAASLIRQLLALIRQLLAISRKQIQESKVLDLHVVVRDMHKDADVLDQWEHPSREQAGNRS
jgi:PAS domain S-box-containing protein